ncbi:discoidin domain-containing protein [Paenibacillus sp. CC-CFT747]|nr:discoidin domain-containing protein [Paenibacillus sp. CC-CFT747]
MGNRWISRWISRWMIFILLVSFMLPAGKMHAEQSEVNLLLNKPVSASSEMTTNPAKWAVDANGGSYWQVKEQKGSIWLTVDLGEVITFNKFMVSLYGYPNFSKFIIQYSNDGVQWADAYTKENATSLETGIFADVSARYVRFFGVIKNNTTYVGLRDFQVYHLDPETAVHLAELKVSPLPFSVTYPTQTEFTVTPPEGTDQLTVEAIPGVEGQKVTIDGEETNSKTLDLSLLPNNVSRQTVDIAVTARNGRVTQNYSLVIMIPIPEEARLKEIKILPLGKTITAPVEYQHEVQIPEGIHSVNVEVTPSQPNQTILIENAAGTASAIVIPEDGHKTVSITVRSEDLSVQRTYSLFLVSPPPARDDYDLLYEDHFQGNALNENDWSYRTDSRFGGYNLAQNVRVAPDVDGNSNLYIDFKYEDYNHDGKMDYTGGGVISRHNFGYGYYEIRTKLYGGSKGLHQSFWTMGTNNGNDIMPVNNTVLEIDGFEVDSGTPGHIGSNTHYYIPNPNPLGGPSVDVDTTQWFTMGYEWLPDRVNYYVNGHYYGSASNGKYFAPQNLWLTALATPGGFGGAVPPLPGAAMQVDYFRYYGKNLDGVNRIGNASFEYNSTTKNVQDPVSWMETGDKTASRVIETDSHSGKYSLEQGGAAPYSTETMQNLEYLPNGTYRATAWVKSSGGQQAARLKLSGTGSGDRYVDIPQTDQWIPITLDNIEVSSHQAVVTVNSKGEGNQWLRVDDIRLERVGLEDTETPEIQASVLPKPNEWGWNNSDTAVSFTCLDAASGIADCTQPVNVETEGANQRITGKATDHSGNQASTSVVLNIDKTAPMVTPLGNTVTYEVYEEVNITWKAEDGLSGIASEALPVIAGPAYQFLLGENSYTATAVDKAGNVTEAKTAFTVRVSYEGLAQLTDRFLEKKELSQSLEAKLKTAEKLGRDGNRKARDQVLEAYLHEIEAQTDKAITKSDADVLIRLAAYLKEQKL